MAGQALVLTPGDGYGYGSGYGDGYGYGSGYGDGSGSGDGYGSGYGSGDGSGDGYGYGSGDGYGYGYGPGYGSGDGDGDGYGYGDGYGDGYGYGYGSGDGYGYGYGPGYGSGYGYGYGDGSGSGSGEAARFLDAYLSHPLVNREVEAGETVTLGWWRSDARGLSANGGSRMAPAQPGLYHEVAGPLQLCTRNALHASATPGKWNGDRWWIVALLGPVKHEDGKAGALRRLIIEEVN